MLGLRFFVCGGCDTVYAGPEAPPDCDRCPATCLREITDRLQVDTYFSPARSDVETAE